MESQEDDERTKSCNNALSLRFIFVATIAIIAFVGYWSFPSIIHSVQVFTSWFDWFCLVIRNLFFVLVFLNALVFFIYFLSHKTAEKNKPEEHSYDQYFSSAAVVLPPPENYFREIVPEEVKECKCCDRVVMEEEDTSRRMRSEKMARRTVEYRRMKSEKVAKTASWRSETMGVLSREEFSLRVETFITEKKMLFHQNDVGFDQLQTGFPRGQAGLVDQWQTGFPQWRNDVVQWQELPSDGTSYYNHHHLSRPNHRLEGGSGSNGSGSYLAIAN